MTKKLVLIGMLLFLAVFCVNVKAENQHEHYAYCDNLSVCAECGMEYSGLAVWHDLEAFDDGDQCLIVCKKCGYYFTQQHFVYCDNPNQCAGCGKLNPKVAELHHDWGYISIDKYNHQGVCKKCGEKDSEIYTHQANCDTPNTCSGCGKNISDGIVISRWWHECTIDESRRIYHYNETDCWYDCADCGASFYNYDRGPHLATCVMPDTCMHCGAKTSDGIVIGDIVHISQYEYHYDEEKHWFNCLNCGPFDEWPHWAECTSPDVCVECGAKDVNMDYISHDYDFLLDREYDNEYHWWNCTQCGEKAEISTHWAYCNDPNVCAICGAENVTMEEISHLYSWIDAKYDNEYHWCICEWCGENIEKGKHKVYCDAPGVCAVCGIPYNGELIHVNNNIDEYTPYNEIYHQFECEYGHGLILERHDFIDGVCRMCGYVEPVIQKGDSNGDGVVDGRDLLRLARYIAGSGVDINVSAADLNGDGIVDGRDVLRLAKKLAVS